MKTTRHTATLAVTIAAALATASDGPNELSSCTENFSLGAPPVVEIDAQSTCITMRSHLPMPAGDPRLASIPLPPTALVSETTAPLNWHCVGRNVDGTSASAEIHYACAEHDMTLKSTWLARDGIVQHSFSVKNRSMTTASLPLLPSLRFAWKPSAPGKAECLWVEKTAGGPTDVGVHRLPVGPGFELNLASTPYSEDEPSRRDAIPFMSICDAGSKEGWFAGIEYSGRVALRTEPLDDSGTYATTLGFDPAGCAGLDMPFILAPGETMTTPRVFVGRYTGDFDDGSNVLRRWVEAYLRPRPMEANYPLLTNNSWGSGMAVDETLARSMIQESAALGLEMFHIDAGWFRGVGDWNPLTDKFPHGLKPIADFTHERGLLFGLWTGWTQGGAQQCEKPQRTALSVFDPAMKDWFTHDHAPDWKPAEFTGADVCLADRRAESWCLDELRRIVRDYKLDLLEHDQRVIVSNCDRIDHGHSRAPTDVARRACDAYYRIYDTLRSENHRLMFEDCVNGGRMVDYGVAQRVHYISICDSYDPLSNRRAFHDNSYCLPASMCEAYISNVETRNLPEFRTMLRSGMMGWCTIMCDTKAWNAEQHDAAIREFARYKSHLRPLIRDGNVYHISDRPDGNRWDGMQFHDPKTGNCAVYAFRGKAPERTHRFRLKGLEPAATYAVEYADNSLPGASLQGRQLLDVGLPADLPISDSSEIIFLSRVSSSQLR